MRFLPLDAKWAWFGAGLAVASALFLVYIAWFGPTNGPRLTAPPRPTPQPIAVHVVGEIAAPGVYQAGATTRVADVLDMAGGATADADVSQLNLAARVSDGERIVVPRRAVTASASAAEVSQGAPVSTAPPTARPRVGLNTASFAELDALPGVGPTTAQKIMDQRQRTRFTAVEQLLELKIVNSTTFQRIKDLVSAD